MGVKPSRVLDLGELRRRDAPGGVEVPREEVLGHGVRVLVGDEEDLVDGRLLAPEGRVRDHAHVVALLHLHRLERSGADDGRLVLIRGARRLGADLAPDVLRQDRDPGGDHVGLGLGAADLHRERVDGHGLLDERGEARVRAHLVVDDVVVGERHVVGGERLAVLPLHALAQVEGPGLAVRGRLPGGREVGRRLEVERVAGEEVVVEQPDLVGRRLGPDERVEVVRVVGPADVQDDLVAGRRVRSGRPPARTRVPTPIRRRAGRRRAGAGEVADAGGGRRTAKRGGSFEVPPHSSPAAAGSRRPDGRPLRVLETRPLRPARMSLEYGPLVGPDKGAGHQRAGRREVCPRIRPRHERPAASREATGRRPGACEGSYFARSSRAWRSWASLYSDSISSRPPGNSTAGMSAT